MSPHRPRPRGPKNCFLNLAQKRQPWSQLRVSALFRASAIMVSELKKANEEPFHSCCALPMRRPCVHCRNELHRHFTSNYGFVPGAGVQDTVRPFYCLACGRMFTQKGNLRRHYSVIHLHRKNHVCPYCRKSFAERYTMKRHVESLHLGIRIQCTHCPKTYSFRAALRVHIRKAHWDAAQVQATEIEDVGIQQEFCE